MSVDHPTRRLRLLGYEELEGDERRDADAHLAECAECRALLTRLREAEHAALGYATLPPLDAAESSPPDAASRAAADESLRALRARLLERAVGTRPARRDWARIAVPLALAAVAALALLSPRLTGRAVRIRELTVTPAGGERGGADGTEPRRVWHSGEAFRLTFSLGEDGYPVVAHLDPHGRLELLYPAASTTTRPRYRKRELVTLPGAASPLDWVFEGEPGPETFFVAATARPDLDTAGLERAAARSPGAAAGRAELVRWTEALLEARVGPVERIEVEHIP